MNEIRIRTKGNISVTFYGIGADVYISRVDKNEKTSKTETQSVRMPWKDFMEISDFYARASDYFPEYFPQKERK